MPHTAEQVQMACMASRNNRMTKRPIIAGLIAADTLLALFVILVTSISGWVTTKSQFSQYWYYLVPLAIGFGVQVGMYAYLRETAKRVMSKKVMAVTGSTSTAAMISCCAHYLVNLLPIISATGVAAFIGQYQVKLFWVGMGFNLFGIAYIARKVTRARQQLYEKHALPEAPSPAGQPLINNVIVIATFAIVVGVASTFASRTGKLIATGSVTGQATSASVPNAVLTQTNSENGMTVAVTPQLNADGSWDFSVAVDNHTVGVAQDMVAVSSLKDAAGQIIQPKAWTGDPPGGHHRKGVLKFGVLSSPPVSLSIRDLGGVHERTFTWNNLTS